MQEKQQGSFFGLGIQIQKRMGKITVIAPMEGTPAYKLGIRAGDIITHIDDEELKEDVTTDEVVRKLRGPKGTRSTITIRRAGIRRADPDDDHARRDPDASRSATPSCSSRTSATSCCPTSRTPPAASSHAAIEKLEKQGMKKLLLRPARQPGRRARPGRGRHRRLPAEGLEGRLHARPHGLLGAGVLRARATAPTSTSRSSCSSTAAPPRPRRSSPARSRTTTAALIVGQRTWGKGLVQSVYTLLLRRRPGPDDRALLHALGPLDPAGLQRPARLREPGGPRRGRRERRRRPAPDGRERRLLHGRRPRRVRRRAASRPTSSSRTTATPSSLQQLLARYAFFNFAVDWLVEAPQGRRGLRGDPGDPRRVLPVRREVGKFSTAEELKKAYGEDPNRSLVDLAIRIEIVNAKLRPRGRTARSAPPATPRSRRA